MCSPLRLLLICVSYGFDFLILNILESARSMNGSYMALPDESPIGFPRQKLFDRELLFISSIIFIPSNKITLDKRENDFAARRLDLDVSTTQTSSSFFASPQMLDKKDTTLIEDDVDKLNIVSEHSFVQ